MRVSREPSSSLPPLPPPPLPPPADSPLSHHDLCIRGTNLPAALEGHVPSERQLMHRALVGTPGTPTRDSVEINRHNILMFTTTPPDSQRRLISSADSKTRCLKRRDCSVHELQRTEREACANSMSLYKDNHGLIQDSYTTTRLHRAYKKIN